MERIKDRGEDESNETDRVKNRDIKRKGRNWGREAYREREKQQKQEEERMQM